MKEIEALFVKVLLLAREMGVLKLGTVALDGTKIQANASKQTRQMAEAAAAGAAAESGVAVRLLQATAAGPDDVLAADGYIFAAPENLAALAGLMKDFFDRCYYPVLGRINGRPYGLLICAGRRLAVRVRAFARWLPVAGSFRHSFRGS